MFGYGQCFFRSTCARYGDGRGLGVNDEVKTEGNIDDNDIVENLINATDVLVNDNYNDDIEFTPLSLEEVLM